MRPTVEIISDLLYEQWDPLGVKGSAPRDEYTEYAIAIEAMISGHRPANAVVDYLARVRAFDLLCAPNPRCDEEIANIMFERA